jgi:hypothetical protein
MVAEFWFPATWLILVSGDLVNGPKDAIFPSGSGLT